MRKRVIDQAAQGQKILPHYELNETNTADPRQTIKDQMQPDLKYDTRITEHV